MGTDPEISSPKNTIIFFDGICNLCNGAVQFIIKRDRKAYFQFASLQSDVAAELLPSHGVDPSKLESILLFENGRIYNKSEAALRISKRLSWPWPFMAIFRIFPVGIRDAIYNWIANNRYKWFGKRNECMLPTGDLVSRFIDT